MAERRLKVWQRVLAYGAFAVASLLLMLFLTFPYEPLKNVLKTQADAAGYVLKVDSIGPGFFSVRATDLKLAKKTEGDAPAESLNIDSVSVGPTVFPPGLGLRAKALGGTIVARSVGLSGSHLQLEVSGVDLSQGNVKGFTGIDLAGKVEASIDMTVPSTGSGAAAEPDLSQATGTMNLDSKGLTINGGKITMVMRQFGNDPVPLDLPKIVLGDVTGAVKFDKGLGTIDRLESKSADIESQISGTLKLAKRVEYAEPSLDIRFKPDPEFQKRLGLIGAGLSMVGADPKDPTWRAGKLTGYLGQPKFP